MEDFILKHLDCSLSIIFGLNVKPHARTEVIFSLPFAAVYARLSFSQTFPPFIIQETARKCPPFTLLRNFVYPFVSKCSLKTS